MTCVSCRIPALVVLILTTRTSMAEEPVYPGKTWDVRSPQAVGLDEAKLRAFSAFVGGRGCVVRNGYMAYTWGDATKRGDVASACKPWFAHFLFKAIEDGKVPSLDEKIAKYEPRLNALNPALGRKDADITWRHCATQTSCYGIAEKPGMAFCYNDWQMALFWDCLFLKVHGATTENVDGKVLRPLLTEPLECEDNPTLIAFGTKERAGRVGVSPRDFCRFGLLYLREGNWKGRQLISREHARMAVTSPLSADLPRAGKTLAEMIPGQRTLGSQTIPDNQCEHGGSYSFLWWVNGVDSKGRRRWPDVPAGAYGCFGHGGIRAMVVIPSLDLVVSWNDTKINNHDIEGKALGLLAGAVVDHKVGADGGNR